MKQGKRQSRRSLAGRRERENHQGTRVARGRPRAEQGTDIQGPEAQRRRSP